MGRRGYFLIGLLPLLLATVAIWFLHGDIGLVSSIQMELLPKSSYINPFIQRIIPPMISSGPLHRVGIEIDHNAPTMAYPPMLASMSPIAQKTLSTVPVSAPSYDIALEHKHLRLVSPSIEFLSPHMPPGEDHVIFPSSMIPSMPHIANRIPNGGYQRKAPISNAPKKMPLSTGPVSSPPRTSDLKQSFGHLIMNGMMPSIGTPYGINIKGPVVSPIWISPSHLKRHGMPEAAPPRETLIHSSPVNHLPAIASSPIETHMQKRSRSPASMESAPLSSFPRPYKRKRVDSPAPAPSNIYWRIHGRKHVKNPAIAPSHHRGPATAPAPTHHSELTRVPSYAPMSFPGRHRRSGPFFPTHSPSPSQGVPASLPPVAFPSPPVQGPIYPPRFPPSHSPSKMPRILAPSPVRALPPPPPNQDCTAVTCIEPLTNTPPGSPCDCVLPMQVGLRLSVALYTFFPLVSVLAQEIATGIFMKQSQVRIMGANAATQQPEKTVVLIDLVPLGKKFDNTTAFFTFKKFWHKRVVVNNAFFGGYEVLYVRYPGLPPSPPSAPTNITINDEPFVPENNARSLDPLGVDVRRRKNRLSGSLIAVIVLSLAIALVTFVGAAWFFLSKRKGQSHELAPISQALAPPFIKPSGAGSMISGSAPSSVSLSFGSSIATYTGSAKTFSLGEIERATNGFDPARIIGEGGFGRVYSGVFEDGMKVAVKVLKRDDQQGGREFLAEVEMLSRLHHRNLVKLIGICTEEHNRCLVYELIPNGSVESHLHGVDKESAPLDWGARMKIALGSARGLAYLHEDSSPRVIHRDFKSSNILLEDDFSPKVSDFGLARAALEEGNDYISTRVMGTFGYVAPEYAMTGHLLVKSDVYSYGVVLLELLTGRKPVDMSQPPGQENLVTWARPLLTSKEGLETIIDPALADNFPFDSVAKVAAIASMCVQPEVSHRPFMGEVVQALKLVCDDTDEKVGESGSYSHELSAQDTDIKISSGSSQFPETHSFVAADYNSGLEAERALSTSDIFSSSARFVRQVSGSFRRHSSSGPLRSGRNQQFWQTVKGMPSGSLSEHGVSSKLWSGLKRPEKWP